MVNYLLDTNVISELRKGARCDRNVAAWYAGINGDQLYLSVIVIGEIRRGVEKSRRTNPVAAGALEAWLAEVVDAMASRIIPVDGDIAEEWGRMTAGRSVPLIDALLAATAKMRSLTLVTRNTADIAGLGAASLDPFAAIP
jgi:predicted nucleic acid-binding protein